MKTPRWVKALAFVVRLFARRDKKLYWQWDGDVFKAWHDDAFTRDGEVRDE